MEVPVSRTPMNHRLPATSCTTALTKRCHSNRVSGNFILSAQLILTEHRTGGVVVRSQGYSIASHLPASIS